MEFDSSVTQDDIDAAGLGAAQGSFGPSGFSSDLGSGDSAEDFNSIAFDRTPLEVQTDFLGPVGVANLVAQPGFGGGRRTNITNVGGDSNLVYDPAFAAALDISQGLDPTLNLGGTGGLAVPAALRPQIPGEFMTTPLGEADMVRPMFFSQGEKFLQQTLPEIVRSGPLARLARGIGSIFQDGLNFAKDATAGIKLPSLSTMFPNMGGDSDPTENRVIKQIEEEAKKDSPFFRGDDVKGSPQFGTRTIDELQLIPDNMVVSPNFNYGITSVAPEKFFEANRNVADALQLIPEGTLADSIGVRNQVAQALDPELKAFIDRQPPIDQRMRELQKEREQIQRENQFRADVLKSIQNRNLQNRNVDRLATINQDYFNRIRNQEPFVDSGNFIVVD